MTAPENQLSLIFFRWCDRDQRTRVKIIPNLFHCELLLSDQTKYKISATHIKTSNIYYDYDIKLNNIIK